MPEFDRAMVAVKQEILYGTLTDHGKLLVGVNWRGDYVVVNSLLGSETRLGSLVQDERKRVVRGQRQSPECDDWVPRCDRAWFFADLPIDFPL